MSRNDRLFLTAAAALLLTGQACAPDPEPRSRKKPIVEVVDSPVRPFAYELADPACQESDEVHVLESTLIRAWDGDAPKELEVKLAAGFKSDATSLVTKAISETTWGDLYERVCDLSRPEGHQCETNEGRELGWSLNGSKGGLRVCKDGEAYGRTTYEGIALTSAHFIQKASDRYVALSGNPALPRIKLTVLPEFVDYYDHYQVDGEDKRLKTWITHNLAYFPYGELIAVFPETEKAQTSLPGFFWESSFVLAHEYGHHVDYSIHSAKLARLGLEWDAVSHSVIDREALRLGLAGDSTRAQMEGAVAEAFADLHAWYVDGGTPNSLIGIHELGVDRNIASSTFSDGTEKILTPEAYGEFLTRRSDTSTAAPNFHDIHIVGAIFARTADEVFERVARGEAPAEAEDDAGAGASAEKNLVKRYAMLLTWLDAMYEGIGGLELGGADADPAALAPFGAAVKAATDAALARFPLTGGDEAADQVRADVCRIVADRLPALEAKPFALTDGGCAL